MLFGFKTEELKCVDGSCSVYLPMFFFQRPCSDGKIKRAPQVQCVHHGRVGKVEARSSHNSSRTVSDIWWPTWTKDRGTESTFSVSQSAFE